MTPATGVLLVNLGTPAAPDAASVRVYLREFLSDPRVLDMHPIARWLLLHAVILPTRPARSAAAYRKIWTEAGSPLLVHGEALREQVATRLGSLAHVELAMRYGEPSVTRGLERLRSSGCDRLVIAPLFPQYASSSTGSALERVYREVLKRWNTPFVSVLPPFYDDPRFLSAFAAVGRPVLESLEPEHVLFSFHGLPERHIRKSDDGGGCLQEGCCAAMGIANRNCYRAQCFATARGLAERLGLREERYTITFQSRLGRTPWIRPYTDLVIEELAKAGTRRLAVFCPAFVADCLETLEEIGIAGAESFATHGGEVLRLVPSLNSHPAWVDALVEMLREQMGPGAALPGAVA